MQKVAVLMSTFNGGKFLKEQIDSVLNQINVDVCLLVRDDGSTDGTQSILDDYKSQNLLNWYQGDNVGPAKSFMDLVFQAPNCDYYAFCDQDDFWLPNKLFRAVSLLENAECPALYCSANTLVNEHLEAYTQVQRKQIRKSPTFGGVLLKCCAIGCTYVFNKMARNQILKTPGDAEIVMHDAWIQKIIFCIGDVIYDNESFILYRQHEKNVIGSSTSKTNQWIRRFRKTRNILSGSRRNVISDIYDIYRSEMTDKNKISVIEDFYNLNHSFAARIRLCCSENVRCFNLIDTILFKLLILVGKI